MSRWFRFHADAMRNPKVARLTDKEFRLWVELLAVASENEGSIPSLDDLKHMLKRRLDHLSTGVERLISMGLIDHLGNGYAPHGWAKHQYKSDVSTDRVQKHRAKRNVSETPPETETETEGSGAKAPSQRAPAKPGKIPMTMDWQPSDLSGDVGEMLALWPPGKLESELADFREYWTEDGTKRPGWDRTFRSRIRTVHDRVMRETHHDRPAPGIPPAHDFRSVRGSRPNPALDMVLQAERELQAEAFRENPGPDWPPRSALPSC